jgi:peptidoglycan L-alanyl-D-glutamate endopeptidase CwlK
MPNFSKKSKEKLSTCHIDLQRLLNEVVKTFDCVIICGERGEVDQNKAFNKKWSKLQYPKSKHNKKPSMAVDVVPYPVNWEDLNRLYFFGGYMKAKSEAMGINIRWGGDWDSDTQVDDQEFIDLPHYELL